MDKNCVKRREVPGKLARDSNALRGSKQLHVNAAGVEGKLSTKLVSPLSGEVCSQGQKSAEAIVVGEGKKTLTKGRTARS
jgi:hypothetical protein